MDMIEALMCKMDMTEVPIEEEDVNHCKMDMIEALTENKSMVGLHVKIARASLGDIVLYRDCCLPIQYYQVKQVNLHLTL
jgi:hypothetical protein